MRLDIKPFIPGDLNGCCKLYFLFLNQGFQNIWRIIIGWVLKNFIPIKYFFKFLNTQIGFLFHINTSIDISSIHFIPYTLMLRTNSCIEQIPNGQCISHKDITKIFVSILAVTCMVLNAQTRCTINDR